MMESILQALGQWSRLANAMPWRTGLVGLVMASAIAILVGNMARASLEMRSDRVAGGPIFALSGIVVLAVSILWWLVDGALAAFGEPLIAERLLLAMVPARFGDAVAALQTLFGIPEGSARLLPPGPVHLPIAVLGATVLYLALVTWAGRTLAELTALEKKPEDVLAREREEQRKAIEQAVKEGRPVPTAEVVSVPLADDLFGRTFKLLGHWTSVELVEERFVRWQRPLAGALGAWLLLSLPAALAGHLGPAFWAGAAVALDGLRRNLRTRQAAPDPPPKESHEGSPPRRELPPLRPLIEVIHRDAGPLLYAPPLPAPQPAQISPGTGLKAKRILEELRKDLPFEEGLLMHQGLACDAFAARKNVALSTPPLSGKEALLDLLVLYTLLVEGEGVLYLATDGERARAAEERLRARAEAARWRWNVHAENLSGRAGSIDLARSQPGLVFADAQAVHRDLCGRQRDWEVYLGALGLVILPDLDEHHGVRGAHLAHVLRRLQRAVRKASPVRSEGAAEGERLRFLATAPPSFRDIGRFAERVVGRPFLVLGPEVDGAPQPDRAAYVLPAAAPRSDLHPAVQVLGEALAQGFAAELFGYEDVLSAADVARANELMIARGVATRGRSFAEGRQGAAEDREALASAQVIIARASAARYAALPLLVSHLGWRAGTVPATRIGALGAGEHVGGAAAPKPPPKEEEGTAGATAEGGQVTEDAIAAADLERKVLLLWQPDLDPFAALLALERPPPLHPDLKLGCALVADPMAPRIQRAHLLCALTEGEISVEELARDFSRSAIEAELGPLGFRFSEQGSVDVEGTEALEASEHEHESGGVLEAEAHLEGARLIERSRRVLDATTGTVKAARTIELTGGAAPHAGVALDASGLAARVLDRHTGDALFSVPRERALSAAYPGRIFVLAGRRFSVMSIEDQDGIDEGRIACEREERSLTTSKIRRLTLTATERRSGVDRRAGAEDPDVLGAHGGDTRGGGDTRDGSDRRTGPVRTLGGASFTLEHTPASVVEEVLGLRRHGPDAALRDTSLYGEPIACPYTTRAAVLGLPVASFGELGDATLHALAHLFRVTLPAFVHHREEDLDVEWLRAHGPSGAPAIAFIDAHPGAAGFADAVTLEVVRQIVRWSLALTRRCPGGCRSRAGCPRCLQIIRCHAEPERVYDLDKLGADRVLALLLGNAEARTFGADPSAAPASSVPVRPPPDALPAS